MIWWGREGIEDIQTNALNHQYEKKNVRLAPEFSITFYNHSK